MQNYNIYFTSDTHFGHTNVIKFSNRPFSSIEEHDQALIDNWNSVVGKNDHIYHLGDFSFHKSREKTEYILKKLNGKKFFVRGNHDSKMTGNLCKYWQEIYDLKEISIKTPDGKQYITLCHFAMLIWNKRHYGAWHLHGHSHGTLPEDPNSCRFDVGVDCWNYTPVSFEQVKEKMSKKSFKSIDHHNERK